MIHYGWINMFTYTCLIFLLILDRQLSILVAHYWEAWKAFLHYSQVSFHSRNINSVGEMKDSAELELPRAYVADKILPPLQRCTWFRWILTRKGWVSLEAGRLLPPSFRKAAMQFGEEMAQKPRQTITLLLLFLSRVRHLLAFLICSIAKPHGREKLGFFVW